MRTKRVWSAVLVFALIISTVTGFDTGNAQAAEESGIIVYVAAQGTSEDGQSAVNLQKTAVQLAEGATAYDAIVSVLDASSYAGNYTISEYSWGYSLDVIGDLAQTEDYTYYWSSCVNNEMASVGIGSYTLADQDQISLIYGTYSADAATQCDCYADDTSRNPSAETQETLLAAAEAEQDVIAACIYTEQFNNGAYVPGIEDVNSLYSVFSLARAGFSADDFYDAVYSKIKAQLVALAAGDSVYDSTTGENITFDTILAGGYASQNYAKIALCVAALGHDPANVGGVDLIKKLADRTVYEASSVYSRESMILFAVDALSSALPVGDGYLTRTELVEALAGDVDNQIATSLAWDSLDAAAMAIQALAPYAQEADVKAACQKVFSLLGTLQGTDGTYGDSYTASNAWTLAQVMITIGAFGINPLTEENGYDFIKNGCTVFDAAAAFVDLENGEVDENLMSFQPEQLLRGLNACIRSARQEASLFAVTDAVYTAKEIDVTLDSLSADTDEEAVPTITKVTSNAKKTLTVKFSKVDGTKKYVVELSTKKSFSKETTVTKTVKTTKATFKKLKSGKKYYVRVRAKNGTAYSETASAKTK